MFAQGNPLLTASLLGGSQFTFGGLDQTGIQQLSLLGGLGGYSPYVSRAAAPVSVGAAPFTPYAGRVVGAPVARRAAPAIDPLLMLTLLKGDDDDDDDDDDLLLLSLLGGNGLGGGLGGDNSLLYLTLLKGDDDDDDDDDLLLLALLGGNGLGGGFF